MLFNDFEEIERQYGFKSNTPLPKEVVAPVIESFGLDQQFKEFYMIANGLTYEWFKMFPIEDTSNIKNTWDSIQRANDAAKSKFDIDEDFVDRFVIFAEIGAGACSVFDKTDSSIWFQEEDQLSQTVFSLEDFIMTCLNEVADGV